MGSVVFAYGRFNPPHKGHEVLVDTVKRASEMLSCDHKIVMSHSYDPIKNPLSPEKKLYWMNEFFPKMNMTLSDKTTPTFMDWIKKLNKSYDKLYMVCGFDRMKEFDSILSKYNQIEYDYKDLQLIECGNLLTRNNWSGTDLRNWMRSRDFKYVIEAVTSMYDEEDIINTLKEFTTNKQNNSIVIIASMLIEHPERYRYMLELYNAINNPSKQEINYGEKIKQKFSNISESIVY